MCLQRTLILMWDLEVAGSGFCRLLRKALLASRVPQSLGIMTYFLVPLLCRATGPRRGTGIVGLIPGPGLDRQKKVIGLAAVIALSVTASGSAKEIV